MKKKEEHSKKRQKPRKKHHLNLKAETGMICLQASESQHTFPVLLPTDPSAPKLGKACRFSLTVL